MGRDRKMKSLLQQSNGKSFSLEDRPCFWSWHLPGRRGNSFLPHLPDARPGHNSHTRNSHLLFPDEPETLPHFPSQRQATHSLDDLTPPSWAVTPGSVVEQSTSLLALPPHAHSSLCLKCPHVTYHIELPSRPGSGRPELLARMNA